VPAGGEASEIPRTSPKPITAARSRLIHRMKVAGRTDAPLNDPVKNGGTRWEKVEAIALPRYARVAGLVISRSHPGDPNTPSSAPRSGDPVPPRALDRSQTPCGKILDHAQLRNCATSGVMTVSGFY